LVPFNARNLFPDVCFAGSRAPVAQIQVTALRRALTASM
jgi:hypothetical protein